MSKRSWIVLFAFAVALPACGPSRRPVFPVKGKVTDADGKPLVGAVIFFSRVKINPDDTDEVGSASGTVDQNGEYNLTTYNTGDGAPEGEYVVTIIWPGEKKAPVPGPGPDRLNGAYADTAKSKIHFTVTSSGSNQVETIKVTVPVPPKKKK
jgi:hypothetical protein